MLSLWCLHVNPINMYHYILHIVKVGDPKSKELCSFWLHDANSSVHQAYRLKHGSVSNKNN